MGDRPIAVNFAKKKIPGVVRLVLVGGGSVFRD